MAFIKCGRCGYQHYDNDACPKGEARLDPVVEKVRADLHRRSQLGIAKYGTVLADNPGDHKAKLQHAYEEALDLANYLKWAIMELDRRATLDPASQTLANPKLQGVSLDDLTPTGPDLVYAMKPRGDGKFYHRLFESVHEAIEAGFSVPTTMSKRPVRVDPTAEMRPGETLATYRATGDEPYKLDRLTKHLGAPPKPRDDFGRAVVRRDADMEAAARHAGRTMSRGPQHPAECECPACWAAMNR